MKKHGHCVRKVLPAAVLLLTCLFLVGFGKSDVELRTDRPLIDLGVFVKDSPIGKGGNPESGLPGTQEEVAEGSGAGSEEKTPIEQAQDGKQTQTIPGIRVEITADRIIVNGDAVADVDAMMERVKKDWRVGLKVYLIDNYAAYTTYTEAYRKLRESSMVVVEEQNF